MMIHLHSSETTSFLTDYSSSDVQPNAIDLRVDKIFRFADPQLDGVYPGDFTIREDNYKEHFEKTEMLPEKVNGVIETGWKLWSDNCYEIVMQGEIDMGPDEAGYVITRSTLNRNGMFITSGLYDSGYRGVMAGMLHIGGASGRRVYIERGAAVGQFLLFKSQSLSKYEGSYGSGSQHDTMYSKEKHGT